MIRGRRKKWQIVGRSLSANLRRTSTKMRRNWTGKRRSPRRRKVEILSHVKIGPAHASRREGEINKSSGPRIVQPMTVWLRRGDTFFWLCGLAICPNGRESERDPEEADVKSRQEKLSSGEREGGKEKKKPSQSVESNYKSLILSSFGGRRGRETPLLDRAQRSNQRAEGKTTPPPPPPPSVYCSRSVTDEKSFSSSLAALGQKSSFLPPYPTPF